MSPRITSAEQYSRLYDDAPHVNNFAIDKICTDKNHNLRKLEVFAFYDLSVLETVKAEADLLPKYKGKIAPNLRKIKEGGYELLFLKVVEWDRTSAVIKCYRHQFDPASAFKLEIIKQVKTRKGRNHISPFSGVSSSINLIKKLTKNAAIKSHSHNQWMEVGDFFDYMENLFSENGCKIKLQEFRNQREAHAKKHNLCLPYDYNDFF